MAFLFKFKSTLYDNNSACPAETLVEHIKKKMRELFLQIAVTFHKTFCNKQKRFI